MWKPWRTLGTRITTAVVAFVIEVESPPPPLCASRLARYLPSGMSRWREEVATTSAVFGPGFESNNSFGRPFSISSCRCLQGTVSSGFAPTRTLLVETNGNSFCRLPFGFTAHKHHRGHKEAALSSSLLVLCGGVEDRRRPSSRKSRLRAMESNLLAAVRMDLLLSSSSALVLSMRCRRRSCCRLFL